MCAHYACIYVYVCMHFRNKHFAVIDHIFCLNCIFLLYFRFEFCDICIFAVITTTFSSSTTLADLVYQRTVVCFIVTATTQSVEKEGAIHTAVQLCVPNNYHYYTAIFGLLLVPQAIVSHKPGSTIDCRQAHNQ